MHTHTIIHFYKNNEQQAITQRKTSIIHLYDNSNDMQGLKGAPKWVYTVGYFLFL